jgi:hypothetical protein
MLSNAPVYSVVVVAELPKVSEMPPLPLAKVAENWITESGSPTKTYTSGVAGVESMSGASTMPVLPVAVRWADGVTAAADDTRYR